MTTTAIGHYPDSAVILKEVIARPENKVCFDCGKANPTSADICLGIIICDTCAVFHNKTFDQDTSHACPVSWYDEFAFMLIMMNIGGNKRARDFFHQHGWTDERGDLKAKFNSKEATLYRSKLFKKVIRVTKALMKQERNEVEEMDYSSEEEEEESSEEEEEEIKAALSTHEKEEEEEEEMNDIEAKLSTHKFTEIDEAKSRFPNAKSISSAHFFRDQVETDDTEAKHRLQKFTNATAISSADLFEEDSGENVGLLCKREFHVVCQDQAQVLGAFKKMITSYVTRIFGGVHLKEYRF